MKKIVLGVIALSILHSILFYAQDFGVSVVLFTIPGILLIIYSLKSRNKAKNPKAFFLSVPITLVSLTYMLFNNVFFNIMNFFVIIGLTSIMILWAIYGEFNITNIITNLFVVIFKPIIYIGEAVKQIYYNVFKRSNVNSDGKIKDVIKESKVFRQILLGLVISIPLLIVIIALLISADTAFAQILGPIRRLLENIFTLKFWSSIYFRILFFCIVCIYFMAFICNILKFDTDKRKKSDGLNIKMQNITVNTVLTVLNIVYFLFTIVQFTNLFMQIGLNENFGYAEYARRGFFQLMIVTFINFAIVLITNANKRETTKITNIYTKIMNLFLIIFTVILICSSFVRMYFYEQEFGYTFLRLMVYFILITELVLIIPTIGYIFSKKIKLLKCYIIIIALMYALINFVNIDKTIASRNVDKYIADSKLVQESIRSQKTDFNYLKHLSIDAIPDIIRLYENTDDNLLKAQIRKYLNDQYYKRVEDKEESSFQEFNYQREKGKNELKKWAYSQGIVK